MTTESDHWDMKRDIDRIGAGLQNTDEKVKTLIEKHEHHEACFQQTFQALTESIGNIDKKLEVFVTKVDVSVNGFMLLLKVIPIVFAIIGGVWGYTVYVQATSVASRINSGQ